MRLWFIIILCRRCTTWRDDTTAVRYVQSILTDRLIDVFAKKLCVLFFSFFAYRPETMTMEQSNTRMNGRSHIDEKRAARLWASVLEDGAYSKWYFAATVIPFRLGHGRKSNADVRQRRLNYFARCTPATCDDITNKFGMIDSRMETCRMSKTLSRAAESFPRSRSLIALSMRAVESTRNADGVVIDTA